MARYGYLKTSKRKKVIKISYLVDKFKGKYRLRCPVNPYTNDFNRKLDGTYEDVDVYVDCAFNVKIFYYGSGVLEVYIPSLQRGHNILKQIEDEEIDKKSIFDVRETDKEILFKMKYSYSERIIPLLKPRTSGAGISPFSSKNLPKSNYTIPESDLAQYKSVISDVPKDKLLSISHITNSFIKTLVTKQNSMESIKADMKLKKLKSKEYIHSIGQWDNYVNYLKGKL